MLFKEYKALKEAQGEKDVDVKLFTEYRAEKTKGFDYLTESENLEVESWADTFQKEYGNDLSKMDEGFLGRLVGGVSGFLLGPTIGKIIANALGVEHGVLYDLFTSKLVNIALGAAIGKHITQTKTTK